jgi:hypothetical protein
VIGAGNISFTCVYTLRGSVSFAALFLICFMFYYGKLCYILCGGAVLCVKDYNMITLYASDTIILIYIGAVPIAAREHTVTRI